MTYESELELLRLINMKRDIEAYVLQKDFWRIHWTSVRDNILKMTGHVRATREYKGWDDWVSQR